jgi:hypothetical protein
MASSAWAGTAPKPGKYLAHILVTKAIGAQCPVRQGAEFRGILYYGGPLDVKEVVVIHIDYDKYYVIARLTLTITSGSGTLRGTFSLLLEEPLNLEIRGSFQAKLISSDADAFTELLTITAPIIDCTEVLRIGAERIS